jgi:Domain of unknown function (DUF4395)
VGSGTESVDARADRAVQGAVSIITLSAFVFRAPWVIPVLAVLVGAGALLGPAGNPFHRLFEGVVAPRISKPATVVPAPTIKAQDILAAALLGVATILLLIGLGGVAWIVTLAEGVVAAVAATTGVHLGLVGLDRLRRQK